MARIHGENANYTFNSVAIEDELNSIDQEVAQDIGDVTAFADTAKEHVEGKYGWSHDVGGSADFAASQGDATIFGRIGAGSTAVLFDPVGGGTAGAADNPVYGGNVIVESYRISSRVNAPATYQARFRGTGALTRDVTP